jgi:hypothetical protein
MLRPFVLALMTLNFSLAFSATDSQSSFNVAQFVRETKAKSSFSERTLSVALIHSPTSQTEFAASGEQGHYVSNSAFGVGVRQTYSPARTLGYTWGMAIETLGNFREINVNGIAHTSTAGDNRLYFLDVDPSVSYRLNGSGYVLAGINYALPLVKNILGTELSGNFGYQAGGGLHVSSKWNVEAVYREINFRGERGIESGLPAKELSSLSYNGLLLRASYVLN